MSRIIDESDPFFTEVEDNSFEDVHENDEYVSNMEELLDGDS